MEHACSCISRRGFLKGLLAGAAGATLTQILNPRILLAQSPGVGKNLVILNLSGGCDGLFLYPYLNSLYDVVNGLRGPLAVTQGIHSLNSNVGMHANFAPLVFAHTSGHMKLIQNVGFTGNSERSHALATKQLHSLDPQVSGSSSGILGRLKQQYESTFGDYSVWGFRGGGFIFEPAGNKPAMELADLASYSYRAGPFTTSESNALRQAAIDILNIPVDPALDSPERQQIVRVAKQSHDAVPRIAQIKNVSTIGSYGNASVGSSMRDIVKILVDNYNAQNGKNILAFTSHGGFDSHGDQVDNIPIRISEIANALAGAVQDLQAIPALYSNTTIMVISEFGRGIVPNGTGTDHGGGNMAMVLGGSVNGGANLLSGTAPSAADLNHPRNFLTPSMDWRHIYAEVFSWMGFDPNLIIPGGYQAPSDPAQRPRLYS